MRCGADDPASVEHQQALRVGSHGFRYAARCDHDQVGTVARRQAGLAARRATDAQLRNMERLLLLSRKAAEAGRLREVVTHNADFHQQIVEASGNPLLQDLMSPLDSRLRRLFRLTSTLNDGDPICGEHERLHEAIRDHDELKAEELARAHVAGTRASAMRYLAAGATENRDSSTQS